MFSPALHFPLYPLLLLSKFSIAEGTHGTDKSWQGTSDTDNPNFKMQQPYTLHWETASIGDYGFRYILLHV